MTSNSFYNDLSNGATPTARRDIAMKNPAVLKARFPKLPKGPKPPRLPKVPARVKTLNKLRCPVCHLTFLRVGMEVAHHNSPNGVPCFGIPVLVKTLIK